MELFLGIFQVHDELKLNRLARPRPRARPTDSIMIEQFLQVQSTVKSDKSNNEELSSIIRLSFRSNFQIDNR